MTRQSEMAISGVLSVLLFAPLPGLSPLPQLKPSEQAAAFQRSMPFVPSCLRALHWLSGLLSAFSDLGNDYGDISFILSCEGAEA